MAMTLLWNLFEWAGTLSFAVSGAIVGMRKQMDLFGIAVLAIVTAVGGGVLRDVLAGQAPPRAFREPAAFLGALAVGVLLAFYLHRNRMTGRRKRILSLLYAAADTVGLASFTVTGAMVGLGGIAPDSFVYPVVLGLVTAVGGGVLRDLMAQRVPAVFVTDVYATASLAGAVALCVVWRAGYAPAAPWVAVGVIAVLRCLAIRYRWQLFRPTGRRERGDR